MSMFVRANSYSWNKANQSEYKNSIVFIEDSKQIYSNGVYYGGENDIYLEKIEFSEENIILEPDKFYTNSNVLKTLDITLSGDTTRMNTYFVEFLCDDTCVILPSNIKWKNNIVPDFTKTAIMTVKIQDDTAYLIDCRPLYSVSYTAAKKVQPNRTDVFGSEIIEVTEEKFILNEPATEIKENAFEGNQDLTSITIPNTVKRIGSKAFSGCSNLEDMKYEGSSKDWNKIELGEDWNEGTEVESVESVNGSVYLGPCVTFTAEQDNSSIGLSKLSTNQTLEYSRDRSNWSNMNTSTNIYLNNGENVYVRGVLSADNTSSNYTQFKMSGKIAASGNCNAIWNYQDLNAPLKKYCGYYMFRDCISLTTAPELPATVLAPYCYYRMFQDCISLTTAPELPATVLAPYCYNYMFYSCTSLTTAPELPATTLAPYCYSSMFYYCTSLTTAPELPATTLAEHCYNNMFSRCVKLNYIKCLATDITAYNCTYYWVYGVASTGTFIKHPNMYNWSTGVNGIPSGWIVEDAEIEYNMIDLGLSVKWADRNVGAYSPEDSGLYFDWGNVDGHAVDENGNITDGYSFDSDTYATTLGSQYTGSILDAEHDAATVNMGSNYRTPTIDEILELVRNTNHYYINENGEEVVESNLDGSKLRSICLVKKSEVFDYNDRTNFIEIPFAGYCDGSLLGRDNLDGRVWSSSVYTNDADAANLLYLDKSGGIGGHISSRYCGFSVRGVQA